VIGRTYLLRGVPVIVRAKWRDPQPGDPPPIHIRTVGRPSGVPRNVLLELPDGSLTVRPFRGLRKPREMS
jgi:hypothetical protein